LTYDEAMGLGIKITAGNEKASFILVQSNEKPKKLKQKVPNWRNEIDKYYQRDNKWIEKSTFRIDSIGELNAITRKGIAARRRRK
jgi:hypothetical protein